MSRIIKSHEAAENIQVFDFQSIETEGTCSYLENPSLHPSCTAEAEEATVEEEPAPDPLAELEETIRNRLFEVERRADELEKEAYEKGYAQGEKDGAEYGRKSMQVVQEHMEELLGSLETLPQRVFSDYRDWMVDTVLAVSRKIVRKELETSREALVHMMEAVLGEAEEHQGMTLSLNPRDIEMIEKHTDLKDWPRQTGRSFTLKADENIERGGCRVESDIQIVDATLDTQFALLEKALRGEESAGDAGDE